MFESCVDLEVEFSEVEKSLADPDVHADQAKARTLGRRYAQLRPIVSTYREWRQLDDDIAAATIATIKKSAAQKGKTAGSLTRVGTIKSVSLTSVRMRCA